MTERTAPAPLSSIMDGNRFSTADADLLSPVERDLVARRESSLASSYRLFYRRPLLVERASGCYLYDQDGLDHLDAYNNVASVGHANPRVVAAVTAQLGTLNTHTRYLQEGILTYAEQLLATMPAQIDKVVFANSGSEANDLAIRVARHWTGGEGIIVTTEAYHGTTDLLSRVSPAVAAAFGADPTVRVVPAPDPLRVRTGDLGAWFAARVGEALDDLEAHGVRPAALLADSIFSSDGIFPDPAGYLRPAIDVVHAHSALFIADEVQPGFARTGDTFWGFERHGAAADLVTLGKPMGNGVPVAALAGRADVLDRFGDDVPYFNTFGGNSVSIAAAQAVLDVIRDDDLLAHNARVGARLRAELTDLARRHPLIADVRGAGLYVGVEITREGTTDPDAESALAIVNGMRDRRVLLSVAGPGSNVLKIRPPYVFGDAEVDRFVETLETTLRAVAPR